MFKYCLNEKESSSWNGYNCATKNSEQSKKQMFVSLHTSQLQENLAENGAVSKAELLQHFAIFQTQWVTFIPKSWIFRINLSYFIANRAINISLSWQDVINYCDWAVYLRKWKVAIEILLEQRNAFTWTTAEHG